MKVEHSVTKVTKRKYYVLNKFINKLLTSDVASHIAKVILFGSLLKREFTEESDIDLLVIASDFLKEVEKACDDIAFELLLEFSERIETIVHCIDEYRFPNSYFMYKIKLHGKEVYKMGEKELRIKEAEGYIILAEEYITSAKSLSSSRAVIDLAYNAAELCARGFLVITGSDIPSSHSGIVRKFSELYIKKDLLPKEIGRDLNKGLELRNKARYEPHVELSKEGAERMVKLAESMLSLLSSQLSKQGKV